MNYAQLIFLMLFLIWLTNIAILIAVIRRSK